MRALCFPPLGKLVPKRKPRYVAHAIVKYVFVRAMFSHVTKMQSIHCPSMSRSQAAGKQESLQLLLQLNTVLDECGTSIAEFQRHFVDMCTTFTRQILEKGFERLLFRWYCESVMKSLCSYSMVVLTASL